MFEQEASYASYMDAFFREKPNSAISWIHDLGQGRYGSAGHALLKDADETNLEGKHVCLDSPLSIIFWESEFVPIVDVEYWEAVTSRPHGRSQRRRGFNTGR